MSMNPRATSVLQLKNPSSVAIYHEYADASRAVDYLAEHDFPVQTLAIVGTDLKSYEKVTGNLTWGKVLAAGFMQGMTWAFMFALLMYIVNPGSSFLGVLVPAILGFGGISMVFAAIQYRMRGSAGDFTSRTGIIATNYEIMAEYSVVDRARALLGGEHPARHPDLNTMPPPRVSDRVEDTPNQQPSPANRVDPATEAAATEVAPTAEPSAPVVQGPGAQGQGQPVNEGREDEGPGPSFRL